MRRPSTHRLGRGLRGRGRVSGGVAAAREIFEAVPKDALDLGIEGAVLRLELPRRSRLPFEVPPPDRY